MTSDAMPIHTIHLTTPIAPTFRTHQVAGLFDLSLDDLAGERFAHTLTAELPGLDEDWTIGAIVGPSGSGKTTLARAAYGDAVYEPEPWPEDVAIIDALEMRSWECGLRNAVALSSTPHSAFRTPHLKDLLRTLAAVGLASPPSWLRPYRVLSTGERFRADLARAILGARDSGFGAEGTEFARCANGLEPTPPSPETRTPSPGLLVFDEFTSTLDRTIACTASFALAKYLRSRQKSEVGDQKSQVRDRLPTSDLRLPTSDLRPLTSPLRFVALSCHTDILPWLGPDWILDLGQSRFLTPSGTSATADDPLPPTSLPAAGHTVAQVPHGVRDLLCPTWPRGSRERPHLRLDIRRVPQRLWPHFARHHYLSGGLSTAATCYAAFATEPCIAATSGRGPGLATAARDCIPAPHSATTGRGYAPIAFCAVLATLGHRRTKHISRLVVLPEWQGLGIGPRLAEAVAAIEAAKGNRVTITASHPSVLAWCSRSPRWKYVGLKKTGSTRQRLGTRTIRCSTGRAVASFEWVGVSGEW